MIKLNQLIVCLQLDDMKTIYLYIDNNYFKKNDIIELEGNIKFIVIARPRCKWYHIFLNAITFGLFRVRYYYHVKPINDDEAKFIKERNKRFEDFMFNRDTNE